MGSLRERDASGPALDIGGAFKTGPPGSKCHWFIPHNAPERFLAQGDREEA